MDKNKKPKKQLKHIATLTGIAMQMGITIYLFVLLGKWLDKTYNNSEKLYIIIATLSGVAVSLYMVLRQLKKLDH